MKLSLLLLAIIGLLMIDQAINSDGILVPLSSEKDKSDSDNDVTSYKKATSFTSIELGDIYSLAKNISHSKGLITQSKEGDPEYRRSYIHKVIRETKFEALKLWFIKHINTSGEYSVSDLQELEHLVHQYETGIDFARLGGMDFLLPLINHKDPKISSAALSVLAAAMQGNPTVKRYADNSHILDYILMTLRGTRDRSSTTLLYALSSYIRNNPVSQIHFFQNSGLIILAGVLKSKNDSMKSKMKVLDLLHDLASEIYEDPVTVYESPSQLELLKKAFSFGFWKTNLCEIISKYLDYDDLLIQEKTIDAMKSVARNVCLDGFKEPHIIEMVENLILRNHDRHFYCIIGVFESNWRRTNVMGELMNLLVSMKMRNKKVD